MVELVWLDFSVLDVPAAFPPDARKVARWLRRKGRYVRWGSLRRTTPVSACWGFDRGTPVDRVYIERFLEAHAGDIRGRVLEVRDSSYTAAYGGEAVVEAAVVDIDPANTDATVVADPATPGSLPAGAFDCIIATQTLQYVELPRTAVANLWRALAPGGVALVTVPCTSRIDPEALDVDRWRFTPAGLETLFRGGGGEWAELEVRGFGNVLSSVGFVLGISAQELRDRELDEHDEFFALVACARARKPP
jgi:SAM-dependent methyltransferase